MKFIKQLLKIKKNPMKLKLLKSRNSSWLYQKKTKFACKQWHRTQKTYKLKKLKIWKLISFNEIWIIYFNLNKLIPKLKKNNEM